MSPKSPLTPRGQKYPLYVWSCSTPAVFELQAILIKLTPNDPKMTLDTKRSKVSHIEIATPPESQLSLRFARYGHPFSSYRAY